MLDKIFFHLINSRKLIVIGAATCLLALASFTIIKNYRVKNIEGLWHVSFNVTSDLNTSRVGETFTQKILFTQHDDVVNGNGEKFEFNGAPAAQNSLLKRIQYQGYVEGAEAKLTYILNEALAETYGNVMVYISDDGKTIQGTFTANGGKTKGTVTGERK